MKWWVSLLVCAWDLIFKPRNSKIYLLRRYLDLRISFVFVALRLGISCRVKELETKILKMEKDNSLKLSR